MLPTERIYQELRRKLNLREQQFVSHYLVSGNATKAARQAGYSTSSPHTTQQIGYETLLKPEVDAAVQAGLDAIAERCGIDADRVVRELAAVALSSVANYEIDSEGHVALSEDAPAEAIRAVASIKRKPRTLADGSVVVETEFKLWDKLQALQLLGRKLKLFADKLEIENAQDVLYRQLLQTLKEKK